MNFFRAYYEPYEKLVDVFKTVDFEEILQSDQYELYQPEELDNLMSISYKFYNNVDDAWILYFFNKILDSTFAIIPLYIIDNTVEQYADDVIDYDALSYFDKNICREIVKEYYFQFYDYETAVKTANETLANPTSRASANFIIPFKDYLYQQIILNEKLTMPIKVPQMKIVQLMKTRMNQYSIDWRAY